MTNGNYSGVPESQHEGSAGGTPTDATETVALPVKLNSYDKCGQTNRASDKVARASSPAISSGLPPQDDRAGTPGQLAAGTAAQHFVMGPGQTNT